MKNVTDYINEIQKINNDHFLSAKKKKTATIITYGCQMNSHDSEKLQGMIVEMGYEYLEETDKETSVDLIIYNTCCIRENAENRVYGNLGALKKKKQENKDMRIVLCGCMMQQDLVIETIKKSYRNVDVIFGTFNMPRFPELLLQSIRTNKMVIDIWKEHKSFDTYDENLQTNIDELETLPTIREKTFRSSVNIMYGCNNFCSYCIVPYVRGRERSRPMEDILNEIDNLVKSGVIEVVLLGQNVNSYATDLDKGENLLNFSKLLKEINKIQGLKRIRFLTSHPKDLSSELIETMAECEKICTHIHLPIQSGSSNVLKRMNRKYTKEKCIQLAEMLREKIPNIAITTDIIVAFPGETEEDFLETLDIYKQIRFSGAFTFLYSKRTGTPAATMDNQIPEDIAKDRFERLLELVRETSHDFHKEHLGKTIPVLIDGIAKEEGGNILHGRAENNALVHCEGNIDNIGKIVNVEIESNKSFYLVGKVK